VLSALDTYLTFVRRDRIYQDDVAVLVENSSRVETPFQRNKIFEM
jgi:hypothetical protein